MEELTLSIEGMSCAHCVRAVDEALRGLDGVEVDEVEIGSAKLRFEPGVISEDEILDAVNDQGYSAARED